MADQINILDAVGGEVEPALERVRLDESETALVIFTQRGERVSVHYCEEPEIRDSVVCAGADCLLCQIGKKRDQRLLLPVYLPTAHYVAVLPVSPSCRPNALLPQLVVLLKAEKPRVAFVARHGMRYAVSTSELPDDCDGGEENIGAFVEKYEKGQVDLASVFQTLSREQLATVPSIAEMARLKGIEL